MWKMPNFRRFGLFKYINCQRRRPISRRGGWIWDLRFEIWETFREGASSPQFPVTKTFFMWYPPRDLSVESIQNRKLKILASPEFIPGVNPKSKISNLKSNDW